MNRRDFLRANSSICAGWALSKAVPVLANTPPAGEWRTFEVVTKVKLLKPNGISHIWLPAPLIRNTPYQNTISTQFEAKGGMATLSKDKQSALGIVSAMYAANVMPTLTLTSRVELKNYAVDLSSRATARPASRTELDYFLRSSRYVPTDGIVKQTALKAGLPARHVYGLRIAKSDLGYKSLGLATDIATKGQHCRAEVYLREHGWVPVDPAEVRKVALEEPPGNRPLSNEIVSGARDYLFGSWEMNWMAYNYAHDVDLPGSASKPLVYFMYPQAETSEGRSDPFDPDNFKYEITVKEIS